MRREGRRAVGGRCGLVAALAFAATSPAPSLSAQTATAGITAEIVTPATVGVIAASESLLSQSPGVLALRIPGAAPAGVVEIAVGSARISRAASSSESAAAMQRVISQINAALSSGVQVSGTVTNGNLNGQGVQIIVTSTRPGSDGDGVTTVIITFD